MNQLKVSIFTSYLRIYIIFSILIVCINNGHASANGIDDQTAFDDRNDELIRPINLDKSIYLKNSMPEYIQLSRRGVWSRLFRSDTNLPRINSRSHESLTASDFTIENGRLHLLPFDKPTIPIELQKAIYAHGIVGRRR